LGTTSPEQSFRRVISNELLPSTLLTAYICLSALPHANVRWGYGGVLLTTWDVLSGRAVFPRGKGPLVDTGLAGRPVAVEQAGTGAWPVQTLARQLRNPFVEPRPVSAVRRADESWLLTPAP
jgi:hypothetical protein